MKKLITIILTILVMATAFSIVSCSDEAKKESTPEAPKEEEKLTPEEELRWKLNQIRDIKSERYSEYWYEVPYYEKTPWGYSYRYIQENGEEDENNKRIGKTCSGREDYNPTDLPLMFAEINKSKTVEQWGTKIILNEMTSNPDKRRDDYITTEKLTNDNLFISPDIEFADKIPFVVRYMVKINNHTYRLFFQSTEEALSKEERLLIDERCCSNDFLVIVDMCDYEYYQKFLKKEYTTTEQKDYTQVTTRAVSEPTEEYTIIKQEDYKPSVNVPDVLAKTCYLHEGDKETRLCYFPLNSEHDVMWIYARDLE